MKEVHMIAQGKGGVGKSLSAAILAQYLAQVSNQPVYCFDTDPVNQTFSRFAALKPEIVSLLTKDNNIDTRNFDGLIEKLIELDGFGVVDNGAATFVPLMSYLAENQVPALLRESGVRLIVHVPIMGGQSLRDCGIGLVQTARDVDAEIAVWLNEFQGQIEDSNGKPFTDFQVYKEYKKRIIGIVHIVGRNPDTFGKDIKEMTSRNLTFAEVDESTEFGLMPRQRLRTVKRDLFTQLAHLPILANADASDEQG
ncbi:MAG: conjugal transfer protein TraL [Neisseria sp.]|uniref:nucleotide-binding protein n=1 Tax=Neisseria sp. TaxID=192066 RepID=UPI0026DC06EC|nr:conjugal transfer protein TraL [Neisseria sp.]MDO4641686.1 conjugal transfer protein TraL [Neisseria sp.]